jgi:Predicted nucleotide-binding protein containing TIR-like domain
VPKIDQTLLERLSKKLEVGRPRVYKLIDAKVRETHLPRHLAAVALASERGINISKYASADDLAVIRSIAKAYSAPPVGFSSTVPTESKQNTSKKKARRAVSTQPKERGNTVFVVHGRNEKARKALFSLLRAFKLQPMEWTEVLGNTGQGAPYVGTILESAFSKASAIVVLLTPDDEARLKKVFLTKRDSVHERKPPAKRDQTCCLKQEWPSVEILTARFLFKLAIFGNLVISPEGTSSTLVTWRLAVTN